MAKLSLNAVTDSLMWLTNTLYPPEMGASSMKPESSAFSSAVVEEAASTTPGVKISSQT